MTCYSKFTRLLLAFSWVTSQGTMTRAWSTNVTTFRREAVQIVERVEKMTMGNEVLLLHSEIAVFDKTFIGIFLSYDLSIFFFGNAALLFYRCA